MLIDINYHIPKSAYVMRLEQVSDNRNSTDWRWVRLLEIFCHYFVIILGLKGQLKSACKVVKMILE